MGLGSVFSTRYSVDKEISLLEREIDVIVDVRNMTETAGWRYLREWIENRATMLNDEILHKSSNCTDEKTAKDIEKRRWTALLYTKFLDVVDGTTDDKEEKTKRLKLDKLEKLKETAS